MLQRPGLPEKGHEGTFWSYCNVPYAHLRFDHLLACKFSIKRLHHKYLTTVNDLYTEVLREINNDVQSTLRCIF